MKKSFIISISVFFGALAVVASHEGVPLVAEGAMIIAFFLMVKHRHAIARFFDFKKIPTLFAVVISLLPFMFFEENINCFPPEAGGCQFFPITYPFLILAVIIVYKVVKVFNLKSFWRIITVSSIVGVLWETTVGVSAAAFWALPPLWIVLLAAWVWLSYAILFVIPVTLQLRRRDGGR